MNVLTVKNVDAPVHNTLGSLIVGSLFRYPGCSVVYMRMECSPKLPHVPYVHLNKGVIYTGPANRTVMPLPPAAEVRIRNQV